MVANGQIEWGGGARVDLMPSFRCRVGEREVQLSEGLRCLVVVVALEKGGLSRAVVQGRLWPDLEPVDAAKRLRQSLWRIRRETGGRLLEVTAGNVRLAAGVEVDLARAEQLARQVVQGGAPAVSAVMSVVPAQWGFLGEEVLAGWSDDGVCAARDRWDRLRLLALERLAEQCLRAGEVLSAIEFAGMAVGADEFSEAPHRIMASAYLARGDAASAWRVYAGYRQLLGRELGLEPSAAFGELAGRCRPGSAVRAAGTTVRGGFAGRRLLVS